MVDFLADGMLPFSVALAVMLALGALEAASLFVGFSVSGFLDDLLPDLHLPDLDIPAENVEAMGPVPHVLGWLAIGRVPALVWLILLFGGFAFTGIAIQLMAENVTGALMPAPIASGSALVLGLWETSRLGNWLGRFLPKALSQAVSRKDLVGAQATITQGTATAGHPADARARDLRGRLHQIRVEPVDAHTRFEPGAQCLIVRLKEGGTVYQAITKIPELDGDPDA